MARHLQAIVTESDFKAFGSICHEVEITKKDLASALVRIFLKDHEYGDDRFQVVLEEARA